MLFKMSCLCQNNPSLPAKSTRKQEELRESQSQRLPLLTVSAAWHNHKRQDESSDEDHITSSSSDSKLILRMFPAAVFKVNHEVKLCKSLVCSALQCDSQRENILS